jgi:hypothetical protein
LTATVSISEWNGAGQTETTGRTECYFKAIDDSSSAYNSYPISAANSENGYCKYLAAKFGGTWASLSTVKVKIDNNAPATGLSIVGAVVTSYSTPTRSSTGDAAMSTTGLSLNLVSSSSAFGTGTSTSTASGTMYSQAFRIQLQTANTYAGGPGDAAAGVLTWSWVES